MDKFNIDMPTDFEIKNQINNIIEVGMPKKKSFYSYIKNMYKEIGLRNLFHDSAEIMFIGILVIFVLAYVSIIIPNKISRIEELYAIIFGIAPIYYLSTSLFSIINLKENNTYEIEMVCKYNVYQIASLRMIIFSVISVGINIIFVAGLYKHIDVLKGIMISISSVFLFSSILLYSIVKSNHKYMKYIVISGWIISNLIFTNLDFTAYSKLIKNLPIVVYLFVCSIAIYSFIKNIQVLSRFRKYEPHII